MGDLFKGLGNLQSNVGKWQYEHGINTKLSQGYRTKKSDELQNMLEGLVKPYIKQAQEDQTGTLDINPSYNMLSGGIKKSPQTNPLTTEIDDGTLSITKPIQQPQEQPWTVRNPLNAQDWLKKNGWLLNVIGYKPDALQMGMLSPDENYQSARIGGKLDLSAKENADLMMDQNKLTSKNLLDLLTKGRENYQTNVEYGGNNDLMQNLNYAIKSLGLDGVLDYQSYPNLKGTKVMTAESQVERDKAAANSSNSTAWRNYNKPFYNPNAGGGGSTGNGYSKNDNTYFHKYENQGGLDQDLALLSTYQPTGAEYTTAQQTAFNKASVRVKTYNKWKYGNSSGPAGNSDFQTNLSGPGGQAKSIGLNDTFGKVEISQAGQDNSLPAQFIRQAKAEGWSRDKILEALHGKGVANYDSYVW